MIGREDVPDVALVDQLVEVIEEQRLAALGPHGDRKALARLRYRFAVGSGQSVGGGGEHFLEAVSGGVDGDVGSVIAEFEAHRAFRDTAGAVEKLASGGRRVRRNARDDRGAGGRYYLRIEHGGEDMQRRHYLAALAVALAGCPALEEETPEPDPEETPTPEPEDTPTPTPEEEDTPTPEPEEDEENEEDEEEEPDPELNVDRVGFVHNWEYLKGLDAAFEPDGEVDFRRPLAVLYGVSVPVRDGRYAATVEVDVETDAGQVLATDEHTVEGDAEDEDRRTLVGDPIFLELADDPSAATATVRVTDDRNGETADGEVRLQLERLAGSTTAARVERRIDNARKDIADGVDLFRERAGGELTGATAETPGVDLGGVIDAVLPAASKLREARRERVGGYEELIDRVDDEHEMIKAMVRSQRRAPDVLERSRDVYRTLRDEESVGTVLRRYRDAVSDHEDRTTDRDESVVGYYEEIRDGRPVYDYGPKIEQVRGETETFRRWYDLADRSREGLESLRRARDDYDDGNDRRAVERAEEALETFESVLDDLRAIDRLTETNDRHVAAIEDLEFEAEAIRRRASRRLEE